MHAGLPICEGSVQSTVMPEEVALCPVVLSVLDGFEVWEKVSLRVWEKHPPTEIATNSSSRNALVMDAGRGAVLVGAPSKFVILPTDEI